MKKQKNKPTLHDQKVIEAHRRNEYLLRFRKLLNEIGLGQIYGKLTPEFLNYIYIKRGVFLNVEVGDNNVVRKLEVKQTQMLMYDWCRNIRIPLEGTDCDMRLIDFHEIWHPFLLLIVALKMSEDKTHFEQPPEIFELLAPFIDLDTYYLVDQIVIAKKSLTAILDLFAILGSSVCIQLHWFELKNDNDQTDCRMRQTAIIHVVRGQTINFKCENNVRPAFRLGIPMGESGIHWASLSPLVWGSKNEHPDKKLDIYIQSHALMRMQERLDGLPEQFCVLNLVYSILLNPVVLVRDKDLLIEYRIEGLKVGYVVATRQKDYLVIRTFLFITFSGTPEGRKLSEITGLGKLDKKYLAIDKLSSFLSSDIRENSAIADIFSRAGCADLLQADKIIPYINNKKESTFSSADMLKYLNMPEEVISD